MKLTILHETNSNLVRRVALFYILQLSLMSSLIENIWILISTSTFICGDIICHEASAKLYCKLVRGIKVKKAAML